MSHLEYHRVVFTLEFDTNDMQTYHTMNFQ